MTKNKFKPVRLTVMRTASHVKSPFRQVYIKVVNPEINKVSSSIVYPFDILEALVGNVEKPNKKINKHLSKSSWH